MSARHLKARDPQHLLDSPLSTPATAPLTTPRDCPQLALPASVAAVVMANSVEGPAPQPSRQPATVEVEAAAGKEERRPSEPVPKKRRLLQATEAEPPVEVQDEREDILAKALIAVGGIDSNMMESEVEDLPPSIQSEGMVGLPYPKEVRPLSPGLPPPPRLRVTDPRLGPGFPPTYQTLEGPYVVRGLRPPYHPYPPRPHDLIPQQGSPPQYRPVNAYPPHHYPRLPPQSLARLPMVRPSERHLPPPHGSPTLPRHFRPPPLHTSPPGIPPGHQTHEVHHVLAAPSHPALPGSSPESPTHLYSSVPLGRPDLKESHLREVYVPVLSMPAGPYPNLHPRIPEGFTRLPYDPRTAVPGREGTPHRVVVSPRLTQINSLSSKPVYPPERLSGGEPAWRHKPAGKEAWRVPRRVKEPPAPCVELIPIGPLRSSNSTTTSLEGGGVPEPDKQPSGAFPTKPTPHTAGLECRRQSAPVMSDQSPRPSFTHRSLSSEPSLVDPVKAPLVEARLIGGRVVTNIITGDRIHRSRHGPSKSIKRTTNTCEEEVKPSSRNSDVTIEKVVYIGPDRDQVSPQGGNNASFDDTDPVLSQLPRICRPASEPPSGTMPPPVTGRRPASVPVAGIASVSCPQTVPSEDTAFTERLQLVLSDLVSVPGAAQLQDLSRSPARLLSTVVRRWGMEPSTDPDMQKRLREDFKTMVKLCMPPTLLQDFGWETCTSEQILTQLIQLSHNGHLERPCSISSSIPLDETLEDDVFSPSTPHHPPLPTSHPSHTTPPVSQPPHSTPPISQPSQSSPPATPPSHITPTTSQPSQPSSTAFQPPQPSPKASQHYHTPLPTSQPSHLPPQNSQRTQPSPSDLQPSQPPPLKVSQPSHIRPQTSHPLPQTSQPSQSLPQTSHPTQAQTKILQPSQSPLQTSHHSQPPIQTSQPRQSPPQTSHPTQTQAKTSHHTQPPIQTSQPRQSSPQTTHPTQTQAKTSHPSQSSLQTSRSSQSPVQNSQYIQPPPRTSQPTQSPIQTSQLSQSPLQTSQHTQPSLQTSLPTQPQTKTSQPSQPSPAAPQPSQQHHVSKYFPSANLPHGPSHLHPSSQPPHLPHHIPQPSHIQPPAPRPTHLPRHIFQTSHHPSHLSQPPTHPQTHPTQPPHFQSPTSQPSHFPLYVSHPSYLPHHTSQALPHTSRLTHLSLPLSQAHPHSSQPTHIPPHTSRPTHLSLSSPQGLSHSPQPTHIPPHSSRPTHLSLPSSQGLSHSPQPTHIPPHSSRPTHLSLPSPQGPAHSPQPTQSSPHSRHTVFHFPTEADQLAYSRLQYHSHLHPSSSLPYRHPTRPTLPPPHHGVRNAATTPPASPESFHQHPRQLQQHQHHHQHHHQPIRFPSEKLISDDVTRAKMYTTTNGQASPPNKSLPSSTRDQ